MKNLEISARTVEEAIQEALNQLGLSREKVEITVLKEGKQGLLGLGAEEAKISVRPITSMTTDDKSNISNTAKSVLETLLAKMGINASVLSAKPLAETEEVDSPIAFDIEGEDLGILIGRRGQTLACLQYIVRIITAHQTNSWTPIFIDVEGYKQRHYQSLQTLALNIAKQVKAEMAPFKLEPMSAYERRIVHLTLADNPDVLTRSIGEGENRRVVILPKEQ